MSSKTRVLFVYPNERQMSVIPPAIAIMSQLLKDNGHVTGLFDTSFYEFEDNISVGDSDKQQTESLQARPITDKDDDDLHFSKINTDPAAD